jgi:hypothetical protein
MREPLHNAEESRTIQAMSWWAVGTGLLGISHGKTLGGVGVLIGAVFAANYWKRPTFGWRRTLDMIWVQILLWPHLYYGWWSTARHAYYGISAAGAVFYGISWMFMRIGLTREAMIAHMLLTACANLSLTVLYAAPNLLTAPPPPPA